MIPVDRQARLPEGVIVSWYGDDFTGSASVMEVLTFAGLPSVLFIGLPDEDLLSRFGNYCGIGIAGVARSRNSEWMQRELPPVFDFLDRLGAPICHYKICSTLDSTVNVGSIGAAIDLAVPALGGEWHPLVVPAPTIGRYQVFGNLFAKASGEIYRLDRHPTMSRHPITPMSEADVREHLQHQTNKSIGIVNFLELNATSDAEAALRKILGSGAEIVAFDVVTDSNLAAVGRLIWKHRGKRLFAIGSQGVECALIAHWRETGALQHKKQKFERAGEVERIAVVSGSCSSDTEKQIKWSGNNGFRPIRAQVHLAVDENSWRVELDRLRREALQALDEGQDPVVFTAMGPDDPSILDLKQMISSANGDESDVLERIGIGLGKLLGAILSEAKLKRGIVAGGDTSGYVTTALRVNALTALAPVAPGAALFKVYSRDPALTDMEIALKGGQMGSDDYFYKVKMGGRGSPCKEEI